MQNAEYKIQNNRLTWVLIAFLFVLMPKISFCEDKATLTADQLFYDESTRTVVASSNACIRSGKLEIQAPQLYLDVDKQQVWGSGNITITRGENQIRSQTFFYDINDDKVEVENVNIATKPKEIATGNLYIRVKQLQDTADKKEGMQGFVTTCDYPNPHYSITASYFDFYPDFGIVGYNVFIWNPIWFVPFGFYMPIYYYALGERNPVLLMPKIGENDLEGYFFRSTWDYVLTKDHLGRFYIDYITNLGLGLGFKHKYKQQKDFDGSFYFYNLMKWRPEMQEIPTDNYKISMNHSQHLTEDLDLNLFYEDVNGYTISGGKKDWDKGKIEFAYDDLGDKYLVNYSEDEQNVQKRENKAFNFQKVFNNNNDLIFNFNENNYLGQNRVDQTMSLSQSVQLPLKFHFTDRFNYTFNDNNGAEREFLNSNLNLSKGFEPDDIITSVGTNISYYNDLQASTNVGQTYLQKIPEVSIAFRNFTFFEDIPSFSLNLNKQNLITGIYEESHPVAARPDPITARRIRYEQGITAKWQDVFWDSDLDFNFNYNQNLYDAGGYGFTDGDKLYTFSQAYTHTIGWQSFLPSGDAQEEVSANISEDITVSENITATSDTNLKSSSIKPKLIPFLGYENKIRFSKQTYGGYTPFFFDDVSQEVESFSEEITFYLDKINKYKWVHKLDFNFNGAVKDMRPRKYTTEFNLKPDNTIRFNLKTGFTFENPNVQEKWDYLSGAFDFTPKGSGFIQLNSLRMKANWDILKEELRSFTKDLNFQIGDNWETSFIVNTHWEYVFSTMDYELKTFTITKDLHCRSLEFTYRKDKKEWLLTYTIKAFPEDKLGLKEKDGRFEFEGVLDDPAEERF